MPVLYAAANETVTLSTEFKVNDVLTDPTTVTLIVTDPVGASTTYTYAGGQVTKAGTGSYWREVATPTAGTWSYQWIGGGAVSDVDAGTFEVFATDLNRLYATPAQMRSRVNIPATDTRADLELLQACRAASRLVEQHCQRRFWRGAEESRTFTPGSTSNLVLGAFNDLVSLTSFASDADYDGVYETSWALSAVELGPQNAATAGPEPRPYETIRAAGSLLFPYPWAWSSATPQMGRVQVTGVWGWPAVPAAVSEATRVLAAELFRAKDAPLGVASFGDAGVAPVRRNPLVAELLAPYRWGAGLGVFA